MSSAFPLTHLHLSRRSFETAGSSLDGSLGNHGTELGELSRLISLSYPGIVLALNYDADILKADFRNFSENVAGKKLF
jgi:hypothetical protein